MRIAVVILCALCSASMYAQGGAAAPPRPPATETVAPAIPGVVAAGTKVAIVKDGFQSSEGPILMPDGTTLFTEPGASKVHKIDKNGTISTFVENTGRANGLALDSKGRLIATTALTIEVLYPPAAKAVLAKMSTRPNDLVVDKKDGIYFTLPSDKPSAVYYITCRRPGRPNWPKLRERTAYSFPGREDAVFRRLGRRVPHRVRRAARRQADESP